MGTNITPEISAKNAYYIRKERYYELKHFSLQYDDFKKEARYIRLHSNYIIKADGGQIEFADPTSDEAIIHEYYTRCISDIEHASRLAGGYIADYILLGVTKGLSYSNLRLKHDIPCSKNTYYIMYREYFFILDRLRSRELQRL